MSVMSVKSVILIMTLMTPFSAMSVMTVMFMNSGVCEIPVKLSGVKEQNQPRLFSAQVLSISQDPGPDKLIWAPANRRRNSPCMCLYVCGGWGGGGGERSCHSLT